MHFGDLRLLEILTLVVHEGQAGLKHARIVVAEHDDVGTLDLEDS